MSTCPLPTTEQEARQQLAALYRMCHLYGWTDLTSTHISTPRYVRAAGDNTCSGDISFNI